jgi:hypothetical protein
LTQLSASAPLRELKIDTPSLATRCEWKSIQNNWRAFNLQSHLIMLYFTRRNQTADT